MIVSEWWELWICPPHADPVRVHRYGWAEDFRIPREGFPTLEHARRIARGNRYAKIVHVVRRRKR